MTSDSGHYDVEMSKSSLSFRLKPAREYGVIHEDEHHLVIDKPAGMGCIPDRRDMGRSSLLELVREKYPESTLVHRLDLETSGIVLVAKHSEAMSFLSQQFEDRTIKKEYLAMVSAYVPFEELDVDRPVGPVLRKGATTIRRKGKDAHTKFVKERAYKGFTRLLCYPSTGRTHQIRIHLADMGLPIVGDEKYGGVFPYLSKIKKKYVRSQKENRNEESPLIRRFVLHARALTYLPFGETEVVTRTCEEASDIAKFCDKLDKFAS